MQDRKWVTAAAAARRIGCHESVFAKIVSQGCISIRALPGGSRQVYLVEDVDSIAAAAVIPAKPNVSKPPPKTNAARTGRSRKRAALVH
jgi:hypothetical protein